MALHTTLPDISIPILAREVSKPLASEKNMSSSSSSSSSSLSSLKLLSRVFGLGLLVGLTASCGEAPTSALADPPPRPTLEIIEEPTTTTVRLGWTKLDGAQGYALERREETGDWMEVYRAGGQVTEYTDTGLQPSTFYAYQLRSCNAGGCSEGSFDVHVYTLAVLPGIPVDFSVASRGHRSAKFTWSKGAGTTTHFRIMREQAGGWHEAGQVDGKTFEFVDYGLSEGTSYSYKIQACNSHGCSDYTEPVILTTLTPLSVSVTPDSQGIKVGNAVNFTVVVQGGNPDANETRRCDLSNNAVASVQVTSTGCRVTGLRAGRATLTVTVQKGNSESSAGARVNVFN